MCLKKLEQAAKELGSNATAVYQRTTMDPKLLSGVEKLEPSVVSFKEAFRASLWDP
jgi:hypothetical protein